MPLHTHPASASFSSSSSSSSSSAYAATADAPPPPTAFPSTTTPVPTLIDGPGPHVIELGSDDIGTDVVLLPPYTDVSSKAPVQLLSDSTAHATVPQSDTAPLQLPLQLQLPATHAQHATTTLPSTPASASIQSRVRESADWTSVALQASLSEGPNAVRNDDDDDDDDNNNNEEEDVDAAALGEPDGDRAASESDASGSDVGTLDSHTLAWDQTRLRIAYLVSTMVTPTADIVAADGAPAEAVPGFLGDGADSNNNHNTIQEGMPSAPTGPAPLFAGDAPLFAGDALAVPAMSEVGHYMEQCPKGWNHTAPAKKREKITQVLYWQGEVTDLGDDVFCGCSVGTTTSYDVSDDSGGGGSFSPSPSPPVAQSRGSHASSEAAMPRLSTVASGATTLGTSAAGGRDRSSTASPVFSSLSTPSSSLSSSLSSSSPGSPGSPGSPSLPSAWPRCIGCKKRMMPLRTVVLVSSSTDDFPWVRRADDDARRGGGSGSGSGSGFGSGFVFGSGSGLRKALRSIRGLVAGGLSKRRRKKEKVDPKHKGLQNPDIAKIATTGGGNALFFAVPDVTGVQVQLVGPTSPMPSARSKTLPEARMWELWEETNCGALPRHVAKDEWALFFPATEMYRGLRKSAEEDGGGAGAGAGDKVNVAVAAAAVADANLDDIINEAEEDDSDDDDNGDAAAKARRQKRDMAERLRRAQALLEQHK